MGGQCDDIIAHLCIIVKWDGISGASQIWGENLTTSGELNCDRQPATLDYSNLGARPRRTPLCLRRTRRGAKNTFLSAKDAKGRGEHLFVREGREGARRTPFCPRRTRRGGKNTSLSAKDAEGREEHRFGREGREGARRTPFCPRRTRRGAKNTSLSAKDAKGREEHRFVREGREGAGRTPFVVAADQVRRTRESGEKRPDSARRRPDIVIL